MPGTGARGGLIIFALSHVPTNAQYIPRTLSHPSD